MLLSFERPTARVPGRRLSCRTLKTAQSSNKRMPRRSEPSGSSLCVARGTPLSLGGVFCKIDQDHRQDVKGTRWMPWHQESMKGVNGCDKPRVGAEWPVIRGYPNGETHRW